MWQDVSEFEALRDLARCRYGADAAGYQAGRPDYPPRVFEALRSRCGVRAGARVLEIGPGSGQVTRHLRREAGLIDVAADLIPWDLPMDSARTRELFASLMTVRRLPEQDRARVLDTISDLVDDRFGGTSIRPFLTALYAGRRPGRAP